MDLGGVEAWAGWFLACWRDMEGPPLEPDLIFHTPTGPVGSYLLVWLGLSPTLHTYLQTVPPTPDTLHVSWPDVSASDLRAFCHELLLSHPPDHSLSVPPTIHALLAPMPQFKRAERVMRVDQVVRRARSAGAKAGPFVCRLCDKVLLSSYALKLHEGVHEGRKPYACTQCQRSFSQKSHLTVHGRSHDGDKPFMCPTCGQRFSISSNLKRHLLRHEKAVEHGWEADAFNATATGTGGTHVDSILDLEMLPKPNQFTSQSDAQTPLDLVGGQLPCRQCEQSFSSRSQLKAHQKIHSDDPRNQCNICDRICSNKTELSKHTLTHTGDRPHPCDLCGKRFVQKSQANHHMRTVHARQLGENPRKYDCPQCAKGFTSKSILLKHIKIHTNERPYPCHVCGKAFVQKAHLHTHLLRHTGVKPFLCGDCGKCFTTQSNLREHIKTHSGEQRKFPCPTCPLTYSNPTDLKVHIRRHTGEAPFQCGQCPKRFRARRHLVNHERTHTGAKPFSCHNCHKTFTTPSGLGQHFKKHDTCRLTASTGAFALGGPEVSRVEVVLTMERKASFEEKRYVQLPPESVHILAETVGIDSLNPNVSRALSEDVSYRTRELAHVCGQFMRHSKRKTLTIEDMNRAMRWYNVQPIYGYESSEDSQPNFKFVEEADVFVEDDEHVSLENLAMNNTPLDLNPEPSVTATWIAIEGTPVSEEDPAKGIEYPQNANLSGPLMQYYQATTAAILGTSEATLSTLLEDIKSNPKISPLLPFFISFIRTGIQKHADDKLFTTRILDLIQALFTNPYLNFSPKPYLSHLVTALLSTLITDRRAPHNRPNGELPNNVSDIHSNDLNFEHVSTAARILKHVLDKWSTSVNQLAVQTHKALKDSLMDEKTSSPSQYGALYALYTLFKSDFEPILSIYIRRLDAEMTESSRDPLKLRLYSLARDFALVILRRQNKLGEGQSDGSRLYQEFYEYFGDSLAMFPLVPVPQVNLPKADLIGKLKVKKLDGLKNGAVIQSFSPVTSSSSYNQGTDFQYFANCEVPMDIFENDSLENQVPQSSSSSTTPTNSKRLSNRMNTWFEVDTECKPDRGQIILNFGLPTPYSQLMNRANARQIQPNGLAMPNPYTPCVGSRMNQPWTSPRYKAQRLLCGSLSSLL
ncbi:hypothetical protein TCAL_03953 [Tigriopus californicus]|uniref:C2H2-type domain-containing protein n=1 Tax=Tigriopus californicus TaxID=6832 RepID=A0A553P2T1_TIGCA|nr:hypothetical protein TCAL_03953 [Tigriopus californicus]